MKPTAYLDIETTGLDPFKHEILEVAIIHDTGRECVFTLPIDVSKADATALEINRYAERYKELIQLQVGYHTAVVMLEKWLGDRTVVGNNVQFDCRFIEHFLKRFGAPNATPWRYHLVDLKALVAGRYGLGPAPWGTRAIAEAVGVPIPDDAHSALADARWNKAVYEAVTA